MIALPSIIIDRRDDGAFSVECGPPSRRKTFLFPDHADAVRFAEKRMTRQSAILDHSMQSPEQRAARLARHLALLALASTILGSG